MRNNPQITIRTIEDSDAEAFLALCRRLDTETTFMMLEPYERTTTVEEVRSSLQALLAKHNSTLFVAEEEGQLVGYLRVSGGAFRRNRHSAYVVIGILQPFTGRGLGGRLFAALEEWAIVHGIGRLELTVMVHNEAAIRLYQKAGFEIEGRRRDSLRVGAESVDEYMMAKLMPSGSAK